MMNSVKVTWNAYLHTCHLKNDINQVKARLIKFIHYFSPSNTFFIVILRPIQVIGN